MAGKGDRRRRLSKYTNKEEQDLRWELWNATPKRKKEILKILEEITENESVSDNEALIGEPDK